MSTLDSRTWLDAAIVLGKDPAARVRCPVCEQAELAVRDIPAGADSDLIERYLECPACSARTVMRMRGPDASR